MLNYKKCTEVSISEIFQAFSLGFSDYVIPLTMDQEAFAARFFGPEGNELGLSFIALDEDRPVGLILGGIRMFDGLKTMRCGTMCIAPDYRGKGISYKLFEMHTAAAAENQCKQLFLEVIKGNDRAIKFYEKHDYRPVYTLKYYTLAVDPLQTAVGELPYMIKEVSFDALDFFRRSMPDLHINWQSDTPCYASSTSEALLGAYDGDTQIGFIAASPIGKVNFLWVDPAYRGRGLGRSLLYTAANKQKVEKVTTCLPSNAAYEGFLRKLGFEKQAIEQFEMYKPL